MRRLFYGVVVAVALSLIVAACSSSASDDSTTTTTGPGSSTLAPPSGGDVPSTTIPEVVPTPLEMCHTLAIMFNAGVYPPVAAESIRVTDLEDATIRERALYGGVLSLAPPTACPEYSVYAEEVSYWLGF